MAREPQKTDFTVDVEGVGSFTFARRTMRDEIKIQRVFASIIDGVEPTAWLAQVGGWISDLNVLTVTAPDGWDIDGMDPLDDDTYAQMAKVHTALRDKERSFRSKPASNSEG
ncbi:hypothetical protein Dolphis_19 [Pseudomonas phage Dolphis]|nr:hypothetical protein Dolphis_19 [Pseudomonas phage Dolphis]